MPQSFDFSTPTSTGSTPPSEFYDGSDAVSSYVPVISSLSAVYSKSALPAQEQRWGSLVALFRQLYPNEDLTFIARSPGRVNLIGEHIDYSLFDVLPMAITQDVVIAVHVGGADGQIILNNTDPRFPSRIFNIADLKDIEIDATVHEWSNYFLAGVKGALSLLPLAEIPSMHCLIDGRIPTGSGLSSSSAFVCAALLAIVTAVKAAAPHSESFANAVTKSDLVQSAVVSERYVGVNSGGMDQSASVFGVPGHALRVQFYPELKATPVAFQSDEFAFVIANTLVVADKHVTGPIHYNLRVVETTLAAEILANQCGLGPLPIRDGFGGTLRGVVEAFKARGVDIPGVMNKVNEVFSKPEGYTLAETAQLLGQSEVEITQKYMTRFPVRFERFQFRARALHVLEEAERVKKYCEMLNHAPADHSDGDGEEKYLRALASLMTASHRSCRDLFDCSCDELDELANLAVTNGAYGSRLTGAGWGGATVSLVPKDKAVEFVDCLKKQYYLKRFPGISEDKINDAICITEPALGSAVLVGNYNV
ncbi:ribosomal protein S5 domain 2-type protein [Lipomyces kononenkoae]|uniref:Ribosomal protein S5 domain 2-type protein n=1 Tax=Lipomyces kononenkoae TaxID=34357 RepID=A0ACC3T1L1_LIPKO